MVSRQLKVIYVKEETKETVNKHFSNYQAKNGREKTYSDYIQYLLSLDVLYQ